MAERGPVIRDGEYTNFSAEATCFFFASFCFMIKIERDVWRITGLELHYIPFFVVWFTCYFWDVGKIGKAVFLFFILFAPYCAN
jgi:hypothetical protein